MDEPFDGFFSSIFGDDAPVLGDSIEETIRKIRANAKRIEAAKKTTEENE